MTKEEYIEKSLENIKNKKLKKQIENELSDHIDERMQFYVDCGYDEQTALSMTVEKMGDPEAVSASFKKLHRNAAADVFGIIYILACACALLWLFMLEWPWSFFNDIITNNYFPGDEFAAFALTMGAAIAVNRLKSNRVIKTASFLSVTAMIIFGVCILIKVVFGFLTDAGYNGFLEMYDLFLKINSSLMTVLYGIVTGNFKSIAVLESMGGTCENITETLMSAVFFCVTAYLVINNLIIDNKLKSGTFTKKDINRYNRVFRALVMFTSFVTVIFVSTYIISGVYGIGKGEQYSSFDYGNFYIAESDEPVDFESLDYSKFKKYEFNFNLFKKYDGLNEYDSDGIKSGTFGSASVKNEKLPMKGAEYRTDEATVYFTPRKRYIAVIPFDFEKDENYNDGDEIRLYKFAEWQDTQSADELHFSIDDSKYPQLVYHLVLKK
ncbi:MAG: hypothetical protein IJU45_03230 [Clostridia bacterium]|nr:hypothetical protein [Clostridia bacterium]